MIISITPAQLEAKRAALAQMGFNLVGNSGTATGDGCTIAFDYDGVSALTINVVSHPWIEPPALIESEIEDFFAQ
jgi:hypothetical protein